MSHRVALKMAVSNTVKGVNSLTTLAGTQIERPVRLDPLVRLASYWRKTGGYLYSALDKATQ